MRLLTFCTWDNHAPRTGLRHGRRILDLSAYGFPARMKWAKLIREAGIKPE